MQWCTLLLVAFSLTLVQPAAAAVSGTYATPLGPVALKQKGTTVTGVMAEAGGPCKYKKGATVLKGSLLDDTVTGTVHICSETPGCKEQDAFVVLLVARKGDLLSGALQSKQKQCKLPIEGKGIAFARQAGVKKSKVVPRAAREKKQKPAGEKAAKTPPQDPKQKDPPPDDNSQQDPLPPGEKPTIKAVEEPFSSWNPDMAQTNGAGRTEALRIAREAEPLINKGRHEDARPLIMKAIQTDPGFAEGYNMMGVTYYARDNYDDALDWYKKALTVNPDFGDAYYNIACIYAVESKKALALKYLRIALLNGYAQPAVTEKDSDLDPIRKEPEYEEIMNLARAPAEPAPDVVDAGAGDSGPAGDSGH